MQSILSACDVTWLCTYRYHKNNTCTYKQVWAKTEAGSFPWSSEISLGMWHDFKIKDMGLKVKPDTNSFDCCSLQIILHANV